MEPWKIVLICIFGAIGLLFLIMIIRTLCVKGKKIVSDYVAPKVDKDEITKILQGAVRIPTISKHSEDDDMSVFLKYHEYMKTTFPEIFSRANVTIVNDYALVIKVPGSNPDLMPGCFLAHQDVVPAPKEGWEVDPFSGELKDGYVYGRGSQDMKSQAMTCLYGLELLLREGKEPERTIYFCFGHDEETTGREGANKIVQYLKENNIRFAFVVDEGGTTLDGKLIGVNNKIALIGVCEKGYADWELSCTKDGGHGSAPKKQSSLDAIADAIHDLKRSPMKAHWSKPMKETFTTLAPYMNPIFKFLFVNMDIFRPLLTPVLGLVNPVANTIVRTTFAFTMMKGSDASNVIPTTSTAVVNTRINVGETCADVQKHIQKVCGKDIVVKPYGVPFDPSPISKTKGNEIYDTLVKSIHETFQYIVAPYMFIGATDAKYYYAVSDNVYRFTPFEVGLDDQKRIHGLNERCNTEGLVLATQFFRRFMENTCYNVTKENTNDKE